MKSSLSHESGVFGALSHFEGTTEWRPWGQFILPAQIVQVSCARAIQLQGAFTPVIRGARGLLEVILHAL